MTVPRMGKLSLILGLMVPLFGISWADTLPSNQGAVLQFLTEPYNPDQAWLLTETSLQFNSGLKTQGRWEVRFDPKKFQDLTKENPAFFYRHRKIQPGKGRAGALFLLLENGESESADKKQYIFSTVDFGLTWRLARGPKGSELASTSPTKKGGRKSASAEAAIPVNLEELDKEPRPERPAHGGHMPPQARAGSPLFKVLFNMLLHYRTGYSALTFDTFHTLLLVDFMPTPELVFSFEVSPSPRFFELQYRPSPRFMVRGGRIWIPFDTLDPTNPHNLYGGFYNTSFMRQPGSMAFLPDLWTDLGVACKFVLMDSKSLALDAQLYVVNGFQSGETDPIGEIGTNYPQFSSIPTLDSNTDKAMGARIHATVSNTWDLGFSVYSGRYTPREMDSSRILLLGLDTQLRLPSGTEFKVGGMLGNIQLPPPASLTTFTRYGLYGELSQRFAGKFKATLRGGAVQTDNRALLTSEQSILGGAFTYSTGLMHFSFLYNRDLKKIDGKSTYEFMGLQATATF